MSLLAVSGLTKQIEGIPVVQDISFSLQRFQKIAIAGETGSGKSTLAAHLADAFNATHSEPMTALGMDGFHLPKAVLRAMPDPDAAFARRGAPWT